MICESRLKYITKDDKCFSFSTGKKATEINF